MTEPTDPKKTIETLEDARAEALEVLRAELAARPDHKLLVFGHWEGRAAHVQELLGPELPARIALGGSELQALLDNEDTFDVIWIVGGDYFAKDSLLRLAISAVALVKLRPGARVVFVASHVSELFQALRVRLESAQVRAFPKLDRYLVTATMNDEAPITPKQEPLL